MREKKGWTDWLSGVAYGKKLKRLHSWNGWLLLLLAISGVMLFLPPLRGLLGEGRVWLRQAHIWIGVLSVIVLAIYVPLLPRHWRQLKPKPAQRANLGGVLLLLAGWILSGIILWQFRSFPPVWNNAALVIHDLFTWVGVPYAVYHSVSRSRWVKASQRQPLAGRRTANGTETRGTETAGAAEGVAVSAPKPADSAAQAVIKALQRAPISRATFLRLAAGLVLVFGVGPAFYRWLKSVSYTGGTDLAGLAEEDGNRMLPPPAPLPESNPPAGGGGQGQFRIYTVTDIPSFSSETWKFAVSGLVEKEQVWDWQQFLQLKRKVQVSDFYCVTGWSVYKVTWEGIPLSALLELVKVKPQAKYVKFYSGDGVYTDALSLEQARMDDVMVAVLMDGKPIPQKLGGPVRLIVPKMYAYKSVKWLQGIELIDKEHIGYWEVRGYDNDAWVERSRLS
ncbi:molybdopterin-dependent oxidoreductase [Paenibacillus filicis]|uniref:Molybdopterin-dependent oxidoreductase n=1 Tax=Paenibacillus gyeongsangnamensis TaxID=3388067 RepID=A0ABT4QLK9_9BACL|nr:molybdopterin-dependent oxidoreductase [Paenibacillus filicis]MCZ8517759.1 molybdopterin-dependent oxidoreductase [Paenibacillus filicis]